ncbi:DUF262 domain-containing HNH endonuclease family protein [uncultured Porphyromonas sp.]|uniref:DUF262 domain-containing protein n=1 Tax=uncultured Porphyromonas sp. TaxID=159274 RepID=UPI002804F8D0|nr:DUF262 domain-containing HNH endonuclease family protein [uncultured Porphyromonas sp.]
MKTSNSSIFEALSLNNTSFFIPPYQRAYSWGKEQINRFFDDVMRLVHSEQDPMQKDKQQHFFGTLVYKWEGQGSFAKRQVIIDGQQRLTTTLIFCIALRDLSTDQEEKQNITNTLLINEKSTFKDKIKLKQVTSDWDAYGALVMGKEAVPGKITDAYNLFIRLLSKQLENEDITAEHFITALQRINVAIIELSEEPYKGEDPQVIFETLNSLGKPLSLSDLIRNYILLGMPSDQQTTIYDEVWQPKIEQPLGEAYLSKFFRDYLQCRDKKPYKVVSDNNTKELYYQFKEFVEQTFTSRESFIKDIQSYVPCYLSIIGPSHYEDATPDSETIRELLRNIFEDITSEAFKPVVLELLHMYQAKAPATTISGALLIETLKSIRTYLIRRRVVSLTQAENMNTPLLIIHLPAIARQETSMIKVLSNLFYKLRLPNDKEIRETLERIAFYKDLRSYSKFILGKMEERQTKVAVPFRDKAITIEHIMPQTLNEVWCSELGEEKAEEVHQHYLHNIGNLILTEFNSEMGNKSFADKKAQLSTSTIRYSHDICQYEQWCEESILDHQNRMISLFLDTFALPEEYKQTNNWKDDSNQKTESVIYPFDGSLGWAKGTKPKQLRVYQQTFEVKNWSGTLLQFVKYFKYQEPEALEELILNQQDVFNRKDAIVNWSRFNQLLLKRPDYQTRYKNLEDKFCTQLSDIKSEELFVHCNATISTILDRMSKAMLLLGMDRKDVVVELRGTTKSSITIEDEEE